MVGLKHRELLHEGNIVKRRHGPAIGQIKSGTASLQYFKTLYIKMII